MSSLVIVQVQHFYILGRTSIYMLALYFLNACSTSICLEGGTAMWRCGISGGTASVNFSSVSRPVKFQVESFQPRTVGSRYAGVGMPLAACKITPWLLSGHFLTPFPLNAFPSSSIQHTLVGTKICEGQFRLFLCKF